MNKDDERTGLFKQLAKNFEIKKVFYPGSYAHLSPAFVFDHVVFNDTYKNLVKFYESDEVYDYVVERKEYPGEPYFIYVKGDYRKSLSIKEKGYDLLVSQYAGFISLHCKKYLKIGGILVANNSHGDSGMASIDPDFEFVAVIRKRSGKFSLSTKALENYFIPKKDVKVTRQLLEEKMRGVGYTKTASNYVFKRVH